jgi:hypothetical protein
VHKILLGFICAVLISGQVHAVADEMSKEQFLGLYGEVKMHNDDKGIWMGYDEKNDLIIKLETRMHYSQNIMDLKDIKAVRGAGIEDKDGRLVGFTLYNTKEQIANKEKAEFERALLEEERREEEARVQPASAARLQAQRQQYIMQIAQKVERNWLRPASTSEDQSCEVVVMQNMMGDVIDVQLQACTSDNAFQHSIERAVYKASRLPLPPDPELFDRKIYFKFKPR